MIELPGGSQMKAAVVADDRRLRLVSGYAVIEDPERAGDLLLVFDTMFGDSGIATRVSIPFARVQFAEFARKMQSAIPSNGEPDRSGPRVLQ